MVFGTLFLCAAASFCLLAGQEPAPDVPKDATPQIVQITPNQAAPGDHLTVTIQGSNFAAGGYASSSTTAIHIESAKRVSPTQLVVQLSVDGSAQPGAVTLSVSNPASQSVESTFTIVAAAGAPTPPAPQPSPQPAAPAPAQPGNPQTPATPPAPQVNPAAPVTPPTPSAPSGEEVNPPQSAPVPPSTPPAPVAPPTPEAPAGPVVTAVAPTSVGQGFDVDLKITGSNFSSGTKVSFSNQGIKNLGMASTSSTQITVHIKVLGDATPGKTSLFVINPDDSEVEFPFEVSPKGTFQPTPSAPPTPGAPPAADPTYTQRFDAFHLGNPTEIIHVHGKVKGSLIIAGGAVKYQEDGKTLVNVSLSEIQEVKTAGIGGFNIKLNSGKTIHFAAASLKSSDARTIVEAIQKSMTAPSTN
jgi:hypothetical protein